ncbi:MAG: 50S ribosomal protein L24 [Nanoarchaeota archaeon]|nr:50S ribosomal protein L24 [Nanoarchaeota archaeon]
MKQKFSKSWKSSKSPRKQRKYVKNAPLHIKRSMMKSRLSKELTKKYGKRNSGVRKGDKVKIVRGNFKAHTGKVEKILTKKMKVQIEGIQLVKRDGNKVYYPIHPSNLIITELNLEDKKRVKSLGEKSLGEQKNE